MDELMQKVSALGCAILITMSVSVRAPAQQRAAFADEQLDGTVVSRLLKSIGHREAQPVGDSFDIPVVTEKNFRLPFGLEQTVGFCAVGGSRLAPSPFGSNSLLRLNNIRT